MMYDITALESTTRLANLLAPQVRRGDVLALWGEIGVGKTTFVRFFLQALGCTDRVVSPTYTYVQSYLTAVGQIFHYDLYRLTTPQRVLELGLDQAMADGITIIEWPNHAGTYLPVCRLDLKLSLTQDGVRSALLTPQPEGDSRWDTLILPVIHS